jgi:hypothetical protein
MAERQRRTVQGRITNGTLFPNISISIKNQVNELTEEILDQLQGKVLKILGLIQSDLETALGNNTESRARQRDRSELAQHEKTLKDLLKTQKEKYGKILEAISSIP